LFWENLSRTVLPFHCQGFDFFESLRLLLLHFLLLAFNFALGFGEESLLFLGKFLGVLFDFWFVSHCLVIKKSITHI
jgi:hypothetical protein